MPAGFGSRLREKIESTRSNSSSLGSGSGAGGLSASKNIRGLTRLSGGTSAPSANGDASNLAAENQGGLLARKPDANNAPSSPDKAAKSSAGAAASSAVDTNGSSLMSSHAGSASAATSAALGGSKIVPGWGAATSGHLGGINSKNKNNGVSKDQQGGAAVKDGPWAMQQSSTSVSAGQASLPADCNIANYQSSQKPRWGDEDDDSDDEEFPQIGKEPNTNNASSSAATTNSSQSQTQYRGTNDNTMSGGGYSNNNHYGGGGGRFSDRDNNRDYQQSGRRSYNDRHSNDRYENDHYNNHRDYYHSQRGGGGGYNNSYREDYSRDDRGFRDYSGHRGGGGYDNRSSSSYHHNHRDASFYNDRRYYNDDQSPTQSSRNDSRWGFAQRAPSHFSDRRSSEDYRHRSGSIENINSHLEYRSSRRAGGFDGERGGGGGYHDRDGGDRYGFGRKEDTRRGGAEDESKMRSSSVASNNVEDTLKQQLGIDANERINRSMPETPMLLLRNTNNTNVASAAQGVSQSSGEVCRENDNELNTAKIDEVNPVGSSRVWAPITPAESKPISSMNLKQSSEQQNTTTSRPSPPVKERSPEEEAQFKKEQAIEQQQSILRQVAERRAARVSRTESEISATESRSESEEQWERGQKVETKRNDNATQILAKKPNPCRKKGHDHDWADCPDNPNSEAYVNKTTKNASKKSEKAGGNPCRKPGHDHDWSRCPDNLESEEYAAKMEKRNQKKLEKEKRKIEKQQQKAEKPRPCRIEGHDHDWRDCPKNPKSANFIRDNPCQIEGHDHDWVDCPDNPKSENYRPPKRKVKKASKRTSTKDAHEVDESETEEKADDVELQTKSRSKKQDDVARRRREESRNLAAKENEEAQAKDVLVEPVSEEAVEEEKPEFVPAPPPKVPAWRSGPPASIRNASPLPSSEAVDEIEPTPVQAISDRAHPTSAQPVTQHHQNMPLPRVENNENLAFSQPQNVPPTNLGTSHSGSISTQSAMQSQPILPPPNALFPGNSALFGESQGSSVYGSWNPPPMVLPSTYVDPWKPNPFAPVSSTKTSIGPSLGGIWSGVATKVEVANATRNDAEANHNAALDQLTIDPAQNETKTAEQIEEIISESAASVEGPDDEDTKASQQGKKPLRKSHPLKKGGKGKPRKEGKPNPCRKPGHDHDWKDCPDNPRSESYVGASHEKSNGGKESESAEPREVGNTELMPSTDPSAPKLGVDKRKSAIKVKKKDSGQSKCRIEGHDHLWKDCPNNKKAGKGKGSKFGGKKKHKAPKKGEKGNTSESSQPVVEASS